MGNSFTGKTTGNATGMTAQESAKPPNPNKAANTIPVAAASGIGITDDDVPF